MDPNSFDYDNSDIHINYDSARELPDETMELWMNEIHQKIRSEIDSIIDLGCGTGRFTESLEKRFNTLIYGIDPSLEMLKTARNKIRNDNILFLEGSATSIPLSHKVSMIFMSMCYHYFQYNIKEVLIELERIINKKGYIVIRNVTKEDISKQKIFDFFPSAKSISINRMPTEDDIVNDFSGKFSPITNKIVTQRFAIDREEYIEKVGKRGLSSLKMIDDNEFRDGMILLRNYLNKERNIDDLLYEGIHLFIFQN